MRGLKLKQLSISLNEARKDSAINRAAVFVEKLFKRPLESPPDFLLVTADNKEEYLQLVREDYGHAIMFAPFPSLLSDEMKESFNGRRLTVVGLRDLLSPIKAYRTIAHDSRFADTEHVLLSIGGERSRIGLSKKLSPNAQGAALKDENLVVIRQNDEYPDLVHELVHFEDYRVFGFQDGKVPRIVREGRAVFAEELFKWSIGSDYPSDLELKHILSLFRRLAESRFQIARKLVRLHGTAEVIKSISKLFQTTTIEEQLVYYPYAAALIRLASAANDPFLAFSISTGKLPETWHQIMNPLDFYKDELRKHIERSF